MEQIFDIAPALSSLSPGDREIARDLHEAALALGYAPKLSAVGKKPGDWKMEYVAGRPKRTLCILRVAGQALSLRAKLVHLADYVDVLEACTERCKSSMLKASRTCGGHGGGCGGPVSFAVGGRTYVKCRHGFQFVGILPEDVEGIRRLLAREAEFTANDEGER
jgi:hypothetical protein